MKSIHTSSALICHKGCVRGNNEDNFYFQGQYLSQKKMDGGAHFAARSHKAMQAYAIFDGMGGESSGERASYLCAREASKDVPLGLARFCKQTTRLVYEDGVRFKNRRQGSTMASLIIKGPTAYAGNVGDSRIYLLRAGKLYQVSVDHTELNRLIKSGAIKPSEVQHHPNNVITQYLGMDAEKLPDPFVAISSFPLYQGDKLLLCSDGLTDLLPEDEIHSAMQLSVPPDQIAHHLILAALELGGKDNTSCIVIEIADARLPVSNEEGFKAMEAAGDDATTSGNK